MQSVAALGAETLRATKPLARDFCAPPKRRGSNDGEHARRKGGGAGPGSDRVPAVVTQCRFTNSPFDMVCNVHDGLVSGGCKQRDSKCRVFRTLLRSVKKERNFFFPLSLFNYSKGSRKCLFASEITYRCSCLVKSSHCHLEAVAFLQKYILRTAMEDAF